MRVRQTLYVHISVAFPYFVDTGRTGCKPADPCVPYRGSSSRSVLDFVPNIVLFVTFDRILFPTDFSTCADRALTYAVDLTDRVDARLHFLHVVNELSPELYGISDPQERATALRSQIRAGAETRLHDLVPDTQGANIETTVVLRSSYDVGDAIIEYVDEESVDFVVMGTHGRKGLDRLMLGNIADTVLRQASCPVMTVREEVADSDRVDVGRILAPVDFSETSRKALSLADDVAQAYQAELHLLFVAEKRFVPTFSDTGLPGVSVVEMDPSIVENAEAGLRQLGESLGRPDDQTRYHVRNGRATEEIIDCADASKMDLVVMGTRGLGGVDRILLGSTTETVARRAPCPVVSRSPLSGEDRDIDPG